MELIATGCYGDQKHYGVQKATRQINGKKPHLQLLDLKIQIQSLSWEIPKLQVARSRETIWWETGENLSIWHYCYTPTPAICFCHCQRQENMLDGSLV